MLLEIVQLALESRRLLLGLGHQLRCGDVHYVLKQLLGGGRLALAEPIAGGRGEKHV